jgi:serine/threonine-protein kinase
MKRCPQCGSKYDDAFKICPNDGARLDDETEILTAPPIPLAAAVGDLVGRTIASRFRIERKLGEGGMGAVFKAEHVKMNRPCAIKILNSSALDDPESLPRFTREAQMSSRIDHPHAVTIYDYGESEEGLVYLAMEYIEGETLTKLLEREGRLQPERALKIAREIGAALDAAHGLGIVHRDLKPDNIMLARKGSDHDFVKVLDFGIAKMAEDKEKRFDLTQAGLIIGTPYYMSPEQVAGEKLDPRSDVYSFALIVYEMLGGQLPFEGQNTQAVMVSRLTMSPRALRAVNPAISPQVEAAVMRGLARERDLRTRTAGELVREIEEAAHGAWPAAGSDQNATRRQTTSNTVPVSTGAQGVSTAPPAGGATIPASPPPQRPIVPPTDPAYPMMGAPGSAPPQWATPHVGARPTPPAAPSPAKSSGVGLWIGLALGLILLGGVALVGAFGYSKGWFTSQPPVAGPTSDPTTGEPTASADQLFQEGVALQEAGNHSAAIAKYRQAIAINGTMPKAYRNLGAALIETKQYAEAQRVLETAVGQDPADDKAQYNLGYASFMLAQYPKAADAFKKAAAAEPAAHAYAGFALDNAGRDADADAEYKAYLAAAPTGDLAELVEAILKGRAEVPTAADL